jgi:hypothetical protein
MSRVGASSTGGANAQCAGMLSLGTTIRPESVVEKLAPILNGLEHEKRKRRVGGLCRNEVIRPSIANFSWGRSRLLAWT